MATKSSRSNRCSAYGTFVPYYIVDSEYLKSLLTDKYLPCELSEPAEAGSCDLTHHRNPSNDSGVQFASGLSTPSGPPQEDDELDFFKECEQQIRKLFRFAQFHLLNVTRDFQVFEKRMEATESGEEEENLSLLDNRIQNDVMLEPASFLAKLQEILTTVHDSIASSFQCLQELMYLHDDATSSEEGAHFLAKQGSQKIEIERQIATNLKTIGDKLTSYERRGEVEITHDGQLSVEDVTLKAVKNYRPGCITTLQIIVFIAVWFVVCFMYYYANDYSTWAVAVRLVRSPFLIVFYLYLYGINIKVWASKSVNYIRIFEFPTKGIPTSKFVWKVAGMFCITFAVLLGGLLFISYYTADIPVKITATVMWILLMAFWFNPSARSLRKGRFTFMLVVVRILLSPLYPVYFGDFWFADQLNSLVGILLDVQYYCCFMVTDSWSDPPNKSVCTSSNNGIRPIISCFPALWRLLQCLRCFYDTHNVKHLLNALKYSTTFPVIIFATLFSVKVEKSFTLASLEWVEVGWIIAIWGIASFTHALYTFIWDVYCDWGLFQVHDGTLLRKKRLYSWKSFYCVAIVLDFILRFLWTLKLTLAIVWHFDSDIIYTTLVAAEIFRRFMWNFFRVEYEQILRTC